MSLVQNLLNGISEVATEIKKVKGTVGALVNLKTQQKDNLVNSINEVYELTKIINDNATQGTATTFSANKLMQMFSQVKTDIIGGAGPAFDTLIEIQNILQSDQNNITTLLNAVGTCVRFDIVQNLTTQQKTQAAANIGVYTKSEIGDVDTNFVTAFQQALL